MPVGRIQNDDLSSSALLNRADVRVLSPDEERELLLEIEDLRTLLLDECRRSRPSTSADPDASVQDAVRFATTDPTAKSTIKSLAARYTERRTKLAMANLRLVAHVARRYRERGLSASDLLQEGFCGLLTAIDRYDASNNTRLASYAVWWIRQSLQRAVAAGAYPVRLNPRHLQKLAEMSHETEGRDGRPKRPRSSAVETTLQQIYSATRPAISLNAVTRDSEGSCLLDTLSSPMDEESEDDAADEQVDSLIGQLKPREQLVLRLRFGLHGGESQSLSQVSQVLDVSKERIRQIQDGALAKLRTMARRGRTLCEAN